MTPAVAVDEPLLTPIEGSNPSGVNLRYEPVYEKVRSALVIRLNEDNQFEPADYSTVVDLTSAALTTKTKDIQLAAWLTDGLTATQGLAGLQRGLKLLYGLIENFWETVHPEIEEGDVYMRMVPIEWIGNYYDPGKTSSPRYSLRHVALTSNGLTWEEYQKSEEAAVQAFETAFDNTRKVFYRGLEQEVGGCLESLAALQEICRDKAGSEAPGLSPLREELEKLQITIKKLVARKLVKEPDPIGQPHGDAAPADIGQPAGPDGSMPSMLLDFTVEVSGLQPASVSEAYVRIAAAAQYLRRHYPASPVSYLLLRAVRWGELRNQGPDLPTSILTAPPTDVRMKLRSLAASDRWADVLELAEQAMGSECGRGWLDLQRYSISACDKLGYAAAAEALRSHVRSLLADFPALSNATLLDDTGAANPDTAAWLSGGMPKKD
jgi:type VI secretion system protein ImpA